MKSGKPKKCNSERSKFNDPPSPTLNVCLFSAEKSVCGSLLYYVSLNVVPRKRGAFGKKGIFFVVRYEQENKKNDEKIKTIIESVKIPCKIKGFVLLYKRCV